MLSNQADRSQDKRRGSFRLLIHLQCGEQPAKQAITCGPVELMLGCAISTRTVLKTKSRLVATISDVYLVCKNSVTLSSE